MVNKSRSASAAFDIVRSIGQSLPEVEESTTYGSPSLKVRGKMFTCIAINKSAEPDTLAVRIDFHQRDVLMAAKPHVYYLTGHYENYPVVLVRLPRIHRDELRNLLEMSWKFVSRSPGGRKRTARKRSASRRRRP